MGSFQNIIKNNLPRSVKRSILAAMALQGRRLRKQITGNYSLPGGFKRIYFYHIRKTAGSSLNHAFFELSGEKGEVVQKTVSQSKRGWGIFGNYVYVVHNTYLAETGDYFYAYSHSPSHEFRLPLNTFTITCLRDPVARVISHYRMLAHYKKHNVGRAALRLEKGWLGNSFTSFLKKIPREHLMRQLYMFSRSFNIEEALVNILKLNIVMFTEDFPKSINRLSKFLNLRLQIYHRKSGYDPVALNDEEKKLLREMLEPEYKLIERIRKHNGENE
jgi:hypothetical protein